MLVVVVVLGSDSGEEIDDADEDEHDRGKTREPDRARDRRPRFGGPDQLEFVETHSG